MTGAVVAADIFAGWVAGDVAGLRAGVEPPQPVISVIVELTANNATYRGKEICIVVYITGGGGC